MIVIVCPGQGSQKPGFLAPWMESERRRSLVESYSIASGLDLYEHGTQSDAETIKDTAVAQPLIVAAGLLVLDALRERGVLDRIGGIAGHSVGEITAAAGAGILDADDAVRFVAVRGAAMAQAAAVVPTGMSAVVGGAEKDVEAKAEQFGLQAANYNGGGQIAVAGEKDALAQFRADPPEGARVIPLKVAGAFHTRFMESARTALTQTASKLSPTAPALPIWSNADGSKVDDGQRFVDLLVRQVASPVRWDRCMESFREAGVTGIIEVAPSGALTGLAKRGLKGVPVHGIDTPEDVDAAVAMIENA